MDIHKPKAAHSWREFLIEIGTIVCGILIALGLEQGIEWLHWREAVTKTEQDLKAEISGNMHDARERIAIQPCLKERIYNIETQLQKSNGHWTAQIGPQSSGHASNSPQSNSVFPQRAEPLIYRTPLRPWVTGAWDAARASGVLSRLTHDDQAKYTILFRYIEQLRSANDQERGLTPKLQPLAFTIDISDNSRFEMLSILGQLDSYNSALSGISSQFLQSAAELGIQPDGPAKEDAMTALRNAYGECAIDAFNPPDNPQSSLAK